MAYSFSVSAAQSVSDQCKSNAKKLNLVFGGDVLKKLSDAAEVTNIGRMKEIYEKSQAFSNDSLESVEASILKVADTLDAEIENAKEKRLTK